MFNCCRYNIYVKKTLTMEDSNSNRDQKEDRKEEVIALYQELDQFLKSEEFEDELKKVLAKSNPNYLQVLKKRMRDIKRQDNGIVFAGEPSSGKSTLINKILDKKVLITRNAQSTSTVCKIRNSEKIKISAEHASGKTKEIELTDKCDINNKEGQKLLRNTLKPLTDIVSSEKSKEYQTVDIGMPIPFLKGDTILVDTPGIGWLDVLNDRLMEYIPNALSFVFIIDVTSPCTMSQDRLPEILRKLICLKIDDEMPCFDPGDVIFITNKWDSINQDDSDSEDEEARTWEQYLFDIKSSWPQVTEKNIFKMSLKEVVPGKMNSSVEQFKEFQKVLMSNIKKTENARVIVHLRYLEELLINVTKNIQARLQLDTKSEEEQIALTTKHQEEIECLKETCNKVKEDLQKKVTAHIEKLAIKLDRCMSTELVKSRVLNPHGFKPIMDAIRHPDESAKEVHRRFNLYIDFYLKTEVEEGFDAIKKDIESFFKDISSKIQVLESEWIAKTDNDEHANRETNSESSFAFFLFSLSFPFLAILGLAGGIVDRAYAPIRAACDWFFNTEEKKSKNIDKEYERCRSSVHKTIEDHLESNIGSVLRKLIDRVTVDELPRQIGALEEMIQQLSKSRQEIISKLNLLTDLASKIGVMQDQIRKIQKDLNQISLPSEEEKAT
ncbi:transmembrane GTPase Marf-like [Crassostrea virginica]